MISYELSDEHEQLRVTVAEFARDVVAPVIGGFYERREFPYEIVARMGKLGLFGLPFPEEYSGMGGDYFAFCIALHELGRVDSSVAITLEAAVALGAMPIYRFGSAQQRARWLPELCQGERLAAFGLTEPGGGSDIVGGMRTTARLVKGEGGRGAGSGQWVIDGSKAFITHRARDHRAANRGRPAGEAGDLRDHRAVGHPRVLGRAGVLEGRLVRVGHQGVGVR